MLKSANAAESSTHTNFLVLENSRTQADNRPIETLGSRTSVFSIGGPKQPPQV